MPAHQGSNIIVKSWSRVVFNPQSKVVVRSCGSIAGKDRLVKYWDADKFQLLLELPGHQAEVWAVVVSSLGDFIVTAGHDRSLRRWERTEEPFFIEEEQERRLESLFEADAEVRITFLPDSAGLSIDDIAIRFNYFQGLVFQLH